MHLYIHRYSYIYTHIYIEGKAVDCRVCIYYIMHKKETEIKRGEGFSFETPEVTRMQTLLTTCVTNIYIYIYMYRFTPYIPI